MKKRLMWLIIAVLLFTCAVAQADKIPKLDDALFADAKQALQYIANGDYESAAALLEFVDADELKKFSGSFTTLSADVQTYVSVAFWNQNAWYIAVPLYEPADSGIEVIAFMSDDGASFCGYQYYTWGDVEAEYSACDYVTWNEEYISQNDLVIIE